MKNTIILLSLLFAASCGKKEDTVAAEQTVTITIATAQCSMCEHNISTALTALQGVSKAEVDATTKKAVVTFRTAEVKLEDLEVAITKAGYDANNKKRDMKAYEELDACCKIPEDDTSTESM